MGYLLKAKCNCCSFDKNVSFGCGFMNHKTNFYFPAIEINTNNLVSGNYINKEELKDKVIFYNNPELHYSITQDDKTFSFGEFYIFEKNNKCPKCNEFCLEFEIDGLWD